MLVLDWIGNLPTDRRSLERTVDQVAEASASQGLFGLRRSRLFDSAVSRCLAEAADFFELPLEMKQQFSCEAPIPLGYSQRTGGAYRHSGIEGQYTNEMLDVPPPATHHPFFGNDCFPVERAPFARVCADLHRQHRRLELHLLGLNSLALERVSGIALGSAYLRRMQARHRGLLRLNHYPASDSPPRRDQLINGEHVDWSSLTILSPTGPGLELLSGGHWAPVAFDDGISYVLVGEQLHRWSNGVFAPAMHRVTASGVAGTARQSLAYFATEHVDMNDPRAIPPVCAVGVGAKFGPLSIRDFLTSRFAALKSK